jgi:hypothetical protein
LVQKDKFVINHVAKNKIEVSFYRIKNEGDELVYTKLFTDSKTKNIWVYGLMMMMSLKLKAIKIKYKHQTYWWTKP